MATTTSTPTTDRSAVARLALAPVVGLIGGAMTALGQGNLPEEFSSVANSAGSWSLFAFLVALTTPSLRRAVSSAVITLLTLLAGYVLLDQLRGYPSGHRLIVLWLAAAVLVGPALGLAAHWLRHGKTSLAAAAAGFLSGLLIGEGVYGLTVVSSSTSSTYWTLEITLGAALLVGAAWKRLRTVPAVAAAVGVTAVVALAFVEIY